MDVVRIGSVPWGAVIRSRSVSSDHVAVLIAELRKRFLIEPVGDRDELPLRVGILEGDDYSFSFIDESELAHFLEAKKQRDADLGVFPLGTGLSELADAFSGVTVHVDLSVGIAVRVWGIDSTATDALSLVRAKAAQFARLADVVSEVTGWKASFAAFVGEHETDCSSAVGNGE